MDEIMENTVRAEIAEVSLPRETAGQETVAEGPDPEAQQGESAVENLPPEGQAEPAVAEEFLPEGIPSGMGEDEPFSPRGDVRGDISDRLPPARIGRVYRANRGRVIRGAMEADLAEIRQTHPHVNSLEEAGPLYRALRFNSYAPMSATRAWQRAVAIAGPKPPSTGSMAATAGPEREYYTAAELDRLTREDLKNEAVYRKAMKSLSRI